jgi:polyisoprenoid-binding protein YceI
MSRVLPPTRWLLAAAFVFGLGIAPASAATTTYDVDAAHAGVSFRIKHLGVSWTQGRFNTVSGSFCVDDENLANARVNIEIESASVDTNNAQRDEHLRTAEFLDCAKHPKITFASTQVAKADGGYRVTGDFTLHGVTKQIVLPMTKVGEGEAFGAYRMGFTASLVVKRSEYGMDQMIPAVGDDVHITLDIEGTRRKE